VLPGILANGAGRDGHSVGSPLNHVRQRVDQQPLLNPGGSASGPAAGSRVLDKRAAVVMDSSGYPDQRDKQPE
jgi:hypothetical protein